MARPCCAPAMPIMAAAITGGCGQRSAAATHTSASPQVCASESEARHGESCASARTSDGESCPARTRNSSPASVFVIDVLDREQRLSQEQRELAALRVRELLKA